MPFISDDRNHRHARLWARAAGWFICLLLTACGGGGGNQASSAPCPFDASLTINDPGCSNSLPIADPGSPQTVDADQVVILDGAGSTDPDGKITLYSWTQTSGPAVALTNATAVQANFNAPRSAVTQTLVFQLTVTDNNSASRSRSVNITVRPFANSLPVADAGADQMAEALAVVTLDGSGSSDPDGPNLTYDWRQDSGNPVVSIANPGQAITTFVVPSIQSDIDKRFFLTVIDDFGATDTDEVTIRLLSAVASLSGTISAPIGNITESDVNDSNSPFVPNDTFAAAQTIPNPISVGGFVNLAGTGDPTGRSFTTGDIDDYFRISLIDGELITLVIADPVVADLDLYLYDDTQVLADSSLGTTQVESLQVPGDGDYFVRVTAQSGASNYNLIIGQPQIAVAGSTMRLSNDFVPGEAIVRLRANPAMQRQADWPASTLAARGLQIRRDLSDRMLLVDIDMPSARASTARAGAPATPVELRFRSPGDHVKWATLMAIKKLAQSPEVEFAEPNFMRQLFVTPNDTAYPFQWHYPLINLPAAWELETGSADVTVAVIDSGILPNHPDLQARLVAGYDFVSDPANAADATGIDPDPTDPGSGGAGSIFHGTHVAGTVGATTNNNAGVAGVAWNVRLMPLRVCGVFGCAVADQIEAMRYAAGLGNASGLTANPPADIINLSLGGPGFSSAEQAAVSAVRAAGLVVVAAAGNESSSQLSYPASYDGVISVSAVGPRRTRAPYSSFGAFVDIAAPGGDNSTDVNGDGFADGVLSTHANDASGPLEYEFRFLSGTSMAAPHVAGVIALMKSANASLTPTQIDQLLTSGAMTDDIGAAGRDDLYGWGLLNAQKSVVAALSLSGTPPSDNPMLAATPASLNFAAGTSTIEIQLRNTGSGMLTIEAVDTTQPWLNVTEINVDGNKLGTYLVTINRNGLVDGTHTDTISVSSSVNNIQIPIIMTVGSTLTGGDVGHLYIVLIDPETGDSVFGTEADFNGTAYEYQFTGVGRGDYLLIAGTDANNNFFICDPGEACGSFPTLDLSQVIDLTRDLTGIDFLVHYSAPIQTLAGDGARPPPDRGRRRLPEASQGLRSIE